MSAASTRSRGLRRRDSWRHSPGRPVRLYGRSKVDQLQQRKKPMNRNKKQILDVVTRNDRNF